ncbi:MAG: hypothetical protein CK425_04895 [Parachlamydia sp.]|nr:MAG: hypothetical protein CK425_04895 [Parachlamydia sp.]
MPHIHFQKSKNITNQAAFSSFLLFLTTFFALALRKTRAKPPSSFVDFLLGFLIEGAAVDRTAIERTGVCSKFACKGRRAEI